MNNLNINSIPSITNLAPKKNIDDIKGLNSYHEFIPYLIKYLNTIIRHNDYYNYIGTPCDHFMSTSISPFCVQDYWIRICKYSNSASIINIMSIIYISRFLIKTKSTLTSLNFHRIFLISYIVACKFHDDKFYSNGYYAQIGGISLSNFNLLERKFMIGIDWNLFISTDELNSYISNILAENNV